MKSTAFVKKKNFNEEFSKIVGYLKHKQIRHLMEGLNLDYSKTRSLYDRIRCDLMHVGIKGVNGLNINLLVM